MNSIEDLVINNKNNIYANKYVILLSDYIKNYSGDILNKDFIKYMQNIQRTNKVILKKRDMGEVSTPSSLAIAFIILQNLSHTPGIAAVPKSPNVCIYNVSVI